MAIGWRAARRRVAEIHPGHSFRNDYERTKAHADVIARGAAAGRDVVLCPGVVYGRVTLPQATSSST
jgi:hypothetical protein